MTVINFPRYNTVAFTASTVADLQTYPVSDIQDDMLAFVCGRITSSDGLGGIFRWDAASTVPDDGVDVVAPTGLSTGRWLKTIANLSSADDILAAVSSAQADIAALEADVAELQDGGAGVGGSTNPTVTVGSGGDYPTLVAALDALKTQTWNGDLTLSLLEKNTPDTSSGSMAIPDTGYTFDHPLSRRMFIVGPAFTDGQGTVTNANMTGTEATDLAFLKSRFGASIRLNGNTDYSNGFAGTLGLAFPRGLGGIKRVFVECYNRYNLDFGYNGSHHAESAGASCIFEDIAVYGGVWGVIGAGAKFVSNGQNFFGYQKSGGPFDLINSTLRVAIGFLDVYARPKSNNQAKYGVFMDGNSNFIIDNTPSCGVRMKGPFVHGIVQKGGYVEAKDIAFDGVLQPFTIEGGLALIGRPTITNANPLADLDPTVSGLQQSIVSNSGQQALISAGLGAVVNHNGADISACECYRYVFGGGGRVVGYGEFTVTDSKATGGAFEFADSVGNSFRCAVSSPRTGSNDLVLVDGFVSTVHLYAYSGVSFYTRTPTASLAANTFAKGSIITT